MLLKASGNTRLDGLYLVTQRERVEGCHVACEGSLKWICTGYLLYTWILKGAFGLGSCVNSIFHFFSTTYPQSISNLKQHIIGYIYTLFTFPKLYQTLCSFLFHRRHSTQHHRIRSESESISISPFYWCPIVERCPLELLKRSYSQSNFIWPL